MNVGGILVNVYTSWASLVTCHLEWLFLASLLLLPLAFWSFTTSPYFSNSLFALCDSNLILPPLP